MEAWIEDLREHPELQGNQHLYCDGKYCCLGRLCIIAGEQIEEIKHECFIEENVLSDIPNTLRDNKEIARLFASMNDGGLTLSYAKAWEIEIKQYTFPEIANFLEQRIEYV